MANHKNLKVIRFEEELLPNWAQLLDLAARLCPVPEETRRWFSRFANSSGMDDARTVSTNSGILRRSLREEKQIILTKLQASHEDEQATQIVAAWEYSLETMLQQAASNKTCSWIVESIEDTGEGDYGDGDITLRRV